MSGLNLVISYRYDEEALLKLLCPRMLEDAFRRVPGVNVFHTGEISEAETDVAFNTLPRGDIAGGRLTAWWDIEACNYQCPEYFGMDMVLVPYNARGADYPHDGRTFFFPFATEPQEFRYWPSQIRYDLGFVGREDGNRTKRVALLNQLAKEKKLILLRTNRVERGEPVSRLLSEAQVVLQCSGDAGDGVMETRFFECGLIAPLAADITEVNQTDMEWAAVPDEQFLAYRTKEELVEKLWRLLRDPAALKKMRRAALHNWGTRHTYDIRARDFLRHIGFLKGPGLLDFYAVRPPCPA